MKKTFLALCIACMALFSSCTQKIEPVEEQLPVNFTNTAGDWILVEWNGNAMDNLRISVSLSGKRFVLWQNLDSMYPVCYTGNYNILEDENLDGMVIRGQYDYTYEMWNHFYLIDYLTADRMVWRNVDNLDEYYIFNRTDAIPEK